MPLAAGGGATVACSDDWRCSSWEDSRDVALLPEEGEPGDEGEVERRLVLLAALPTGVWGGC